MEDSNEVHSEENRVSSEKNNKRILKTPAQLVALENFYNEHMYPSEELKSEMAKTIGLTEKQVSSWFCHRRLKDKKLREGLNVQQDRTGNVVPDRSSGLWQDSCGSTKQGEHRNVDLREVESQSLYGHDLPPTRPIYDRTYQYKGNVSGIDDTSSESSSSLQDKFLSQRDDHLGMDTSRHVTQNGGRMPLFSKGLSGMGYKPSGYLKVKGEVENAAITAVKKQLGRQYREDGPALGVEFEPLPPGAFVSQTAEPVQGPVYVGDLGRNHSSDGSGVRKQSSLSSRHEVYNSSKMSSLGSYMEEANHNQKYARNSLDRKSLAQLKQVRTVDMFDNLAAEVPSYGGEKKTKKSKHSIERLRPDQVVAHHGPSGWKVIDGERRPFSQGYFNRNPKKVKRKDHISKPSMVFSTSDKSLYAEERVPYTRMTQEEKIYEEMRASKEYGDTGRANRHSANEMMRYGAQFQEEEDDEYVGNESLAYMQQRSIPLKRPVMERPTSLSGDETGESSDSED